MINFDATRYTDAQCRAEFERLFLAGFAGSDVVAEIAPEGWEMSPLIAAFHPFFEQVYEESVQMHRNMQSLFRRKADMPLKPEPTREEVAESHRTMPIDTRREVLDLVGMCLWDVFSDNHEVIASDGRVVDIGSFRAAGGFLAELANDEQDSSEYDYMNFYMGTIWIRQRADLTPVYQMIFRRLKRRDLDWVYHFPRLRLVDLRPLQESLRSADEPEWADYSPSEALAKQQAEETRDRETAEMRAQLDEGYREAIEAARDRPPPRTVQAYQIVYGEFPRGWPPAAEDEL